MAEPSGIPILRAEGLARSFPSGDGTIDVLRGASLEIAAGSLVAVCGRSGAGKTTLLNLIAGLDRPDAGGIVVDGADIAALDAAGLARLRREVVAVVPQAPSLLAILTASENVEVPLRIRRASSAERAERVAAALDAVGLAARAGHRPDELSGGEQQRVAVARAIVGRPRLLVADEPTAQLDHDTSRTISALLRSQVEQGGRAVLTATNDPELIAVADAVYELREGRLERREDAATPR